MAYFEKLINQYKCFSEPVKASLWFTVCSVMQKALALLTVPIFTRLMTVEQYGVFTLYQSWFNIIIIVTTLNLHLAVFNTAMVKFENRDKYVSSMQGLTTVITLLVALIYYILSAQLQTVIGLSQIVMVVMFIDLLFYPAFYFWAAKQRYEYKYRALVVVTLLVTLLSSVIGTIAVLLSSAVGEARIFSVAFVEIVIFTAIYYINFRKNKTFYCGEYWKYALSFCIPLLPHYLAGTILNQSDRIMINYFDGTDKAAIYGIAYSSAMLSLLFVNAINASFTPWLYEKLKLKKLEQIPNVAIQLMGIVCTVNGVLVIFAPEIMLILGGSEYAEAQWVFPVLSASTCFIFLYCFFASVEFFFEKKYFIMIASVMSAILNVVLNFIFIPKFGYYAAAYTTVVCYAFYALTHWIFMTRVLKQAEYPVTLYTSKTMFSMTCTVSIWCLICLITYEYTIIRIGIFLLLVVVLLIVRKKIVNYIKALFTSLKGKNCNE